MKKLLGCTIILILSSFYCYSQDTVKISTQLLDSVITRLIKAKYDDKLIKDQNKVIKVYEHKDSLQSKQINSLKTINKDYESTVTSYTKLDKVQETEIKTLKSEIKKTGLKGFLFGTAVGIVITLILTL